MALEQCYNKGCGQKYDPTKNNEEACRFHPGAPFFHDAYKGWSCCNKKCTDFTEFLNIQGCTLAKHSNSKPTEPEKPRVEEVEEVIPVKPMVKSSLERPCLETPFTKLSPEIAPSLKCQIPNIDSATPDQKTNTTDIVVGTSCKNGGCSATYQDPSSNMDLCLHHPGIPIFHEGMKYWSCCQRKTSDFTAFLNQEGCREGKHVWKKECEDETVQCRWDYHQTGPYVIVSIYAKEYSPTKSEIRLNPVRLYASLVFPKQGSASFDLDVELHGIVDLSQSKVSMFGTKVEIKLKKAEACTWPKLERNVLKTVDKPKPVVDTKVVTQKIEDVDLSDL